jgi:hypothetical protein
MRSEGLPRCTAIRGWDKRHNNRALALTHARSIALFKNPCPARGFPGSRFLSPETRKFSQLQMLLGGQTILGSEILSITSLLQKGDLT